MVGLMTAEELAATLAVSPETIKAWARDGVIPAVRITPKSVRFDWHTVLRELAKRQTGVGGEQYRSRFPAGERSPRWHGSDLNCTSINQNSKGGTSDE